MDLMRDTGAYRTQCQFFPGVDQPVTITWYRCPPGAKPFPAQHAFYSRNWDQVKRLTDGIGEERDAYRPHSSGTTPPLVTGQHFDGPLKWFQQGVPWDPARPPTARNAFGLIVDCAPGEVDRPVQASELSGGGVDWSLFPPDLCSTPHPPAVLFGRINAPSLAYVLFRLRPVTPYIWGTITIIDGPVYAPPGPCVLFPFVPGVYLGMRCELPIVGGFGLQTSVALSPINVEQDYWPPTAILPGPPVQWVFANVDYGAGGGLLPGCWLNLTVQLVPFGADREVEAGEVSGGGVDVPPTVYEQVEAGEISGGGVEVTVYVYPVAGEISGGGVSH